MTVNNVDRSGINGTVDVFAGNANRQIIDSIVVHVACREGRPVEVIILRSVAEAAGALLLKQQFYRMIYLLLVVVVGSQS